MTQTPSSKSKKKPVQADTDFPIVGIGASAGGLAAFEAFFSAMPVDSVPGMAFVLVQHLSPDHKSILADILKRYTAMQVFEVEDGMRVQRNCAYIIPPNRDMVLMNGTLQLLNQGASRGLRLPIDFFFRSMAADQHERSIGIILSGTGSDGTIGVREIKGEGGIVMVQLPESTEYDAMPRNAIATGLVDYILPPAEMPAQLLAFTAHSVGRTANQGLKPDLCVEDSKKKILAMLRIQTKHDFSQYKKNTIDRRIDHRMAVHEISRLSEYVRFLHQNPAEVNALFYDLLIGVTKFFRDSAVFKTFNEKIIPQLFADNPLGELIRVWVPACSTGEEAYTIAILLQEHMEKIKQNFTVQVFATDIDNRAIERARTGVYPASIAINVTEERLERYFTASADGSSFTIRKVIRDLLIFSQQNVIKDPPFSKLDLISCRNLLIYMDGELQKKLIPLFHYALKPGGFLFLGTSESVSVFESLFSTVDLKGKLYRRKEEIETMTHNRHLGRFLPPVFEDTERRLPGGTHSTKVPPRELIERTLLQDYTPVGVLITEHGEILFVHGRTGLYLEPSPGEAGMNILKMARKGLRQPLTIALTKAVVTKELIHLPRLQVKTSSHLTTFNLTVQPVASNPEASSSRPLFLVILQEVPGHSEKPTPLEAEEEAESGAKDVDTRIVVLKKELQAKEEYLQSANEELETSNEELQSSNEEMQSVNEELQSTNEELETSKEELQSVNEELATVNSELQTKVVDLSRLNNDMSNLLAGTGMGTIFVDHQLRIQRFTPSITEVINLIPTDVGRPVGHIVTNLKGYDRLVQDMQSVLDTLIPKEIEVQTKAGEWFLLGIRPYRTLDNVIEGAVITFVNISLMIKAQATLRESESLRRLAAVVLNSQDAIIAKDLEGRVLAWNPGAERIYGWSEAEALQMNFNDMIPEKQREEEITKVKRLALAEKMKTYRAARLTKEGRTVEVWVAATALIRDSQEVYAITTTERFVNK